MEVPSSSSSFAYPETREEVCATLRELFAVDDFNEKTPFYELQHRLAVASFIKASTPTACSYDRITETFAAMDAYPADACIQATQLAQCLQDIDDKNSGARIAKTGLGRIYRAMKLSTECAQYGCKVLSSLHLLGALNIPECNGVKAVLGAMSQFNDESLYILGVRFLHAVITSSQENAAEVAKEFHVVAPLVLTAKHAVETYSIELVEVCNAILMSL
jgi:hypothetical protein